MCTRPLSLICTPMLHFAMSQFMNIYLKRNTNVFCISYAFFAFPLAPQLQAKRKSDRGKFVHLTNKVFFLHTCILYAIYAHPLI